jgi:hypothetical protein
LGCIGCLLQEAKGSWSARKSFGGKVVEDHFIQQVDGAEDVAAFTLRTYCEQTQRWEMAYLWATQPATGVIAFVGNRVDNEMHFDLQQLGLNGLVIIARIRFFDISDDSFSWENRTSVDNGATWILSTLLKLRRRNKGS